MNLVRWTAPRGLFRSDTDHLFDRVFGSLSRPFWDSPDLLATTTRTAWVPPVDVFTRDGDLVIRAEVPGIDPEKDMEITLQDGRLRLQGERKLENRSESNGYTRLEASYGSFERTVLLPEGVEPDQIHASYENGILEIVVPKVAELHEGRRIPIQVSGQRALTTEGEKVST